MGSNLNFMNSFGNDPSSNGSGGRPPGNNNHLARQSSIYSLTFDEFQNTVGSLGRDYGSMNMDELLKNIWSAEENQNMVSTSGSAVGNIGGGAPLQRQGSLTLPRTLSQRTVDEVWREMSREGSVPGGANIPQRQQTLGEITLEEFLVRAGVVREDTQMNVKPTNGVGGGMFLSDLSRSNNPTGLGIGFQQLGSRGTGLMGNQTNNDQISIQAANLPLNVNGVPSNHPQFPQQHQHRHQHQHQHQQQIFPKQPVVSYASQLSLSTSTQLAGAGMKGGTMGINADHGLSNNALVNGGAMGMVGLGAGPVTVATGSPANLSSDGMKSNGTDTSSVSPVPYVFNGGLRGRKSNGAVEKVVERRQRRMIKNRESAARSRARKQAYTMELEAEVQKLKEENQELRKKQAEMMEMQKTQVMEMTNRQGRAKKRCLRRTQTAPW